MLRFLALPLFLLPLAAQAETAPSPDSCEQTTQVEIAACLVGVEARADALLGQAEARALDSARRLDAITERVEALPAYETALAAWHAWRDAQCAAVGASYGGGSGTGIAVHSCRIALARAQIGALNELAP